MKEGNASKIFRNFSVSLQLMTLILGKCEDKTTKYAGIIRNKTYRTGSILTCETKIGLAMCIVSCAELGGCSHVNYNGEELTCALMSDDENITHSGLIEVGDSSKMKDEIGNVFVLMNHSRVVCGTKVCRADTICVETSSGKKLCVHIQKQCCKDKHLLPVQGGAGSDRVTFSSNNYTDRNYYKPGDPGGLVPVVHDTQQWVQVVFNSIRLVVGVVTRGSGVENSDQSWVSSYHIKYLRGDVWVYIKTSSGSVVIFPGNKDPDSRMKNYFFRPLNTAGIQLRPLTWQNYIEMRFDVLGC